MQEARLEADKLSSYVWAAISTPSELSDLSLKHKIPGRDEPPKDWAQYPEGYARYAAFIASDPDRSTTIYRKYKRLSARNLLYLEAEVAELEQQLDVLDVDDTTIVDIAARDEVTDGAQDWTHLKEQVYSKKPAVKARAALRIELVMRIRERLREYRKYDSAANFSHANSVYQMKHLS